MSRNICRMTVVAFLVVVFTLVVVSCNEPAPPPPPPVAAAPAAPVPPVPQQPVAVAPAAPPATPLVPVGEADDQADEEPSKKKVGDSIDAPLPGAKTPGDELVGNYTCALDSKKLRLGPFKAPPFGCKINKAGDGSLKVASTAEGAGSLKGNVKDSTAVGFFIVGTYTVAGNDLKIKTRMKLKGEGKYVGKGRGRFNDEEDNQIVYTLTMTKK